MLRNGWRRLLMGWRRAEVVPARSGGQQCYAGYVRLGAEQVQVDFAVPLGASAQDMDSAFLAALSQVAELDYLLIGGDEPPA